MVSVLLHRSFYTTSRYSTLYMSHAIATSAPFGVPSRGLYKERLRRTFRRLRRSRSLFV